MDIVDLLERAKAAGVSVNIQDGQLRVKGPESEENLVQEITDHKEDIVRYLNGEPAEPNDEELHDAPWPAIESFDELPRALVKARIVAGLSQKELAERLHMPLDKVKKVFDNIYDYASKISKITVKYTYNTLHRHTNIRSDQFVDYNFRLGLIWTPEELQYNETNDQISSYMHDFDRELRISLPTLTVIPNLSITSIEFKNKTSNSIESSSSPDSSRVVSYFPLGIRGDKGLPMISWGLTYTGLEKNSFINCSVNWFY